VYVRLAVSWTDSAGVAHAAGEIVDIDAITLAQLEEGGVVDEIKEPEGTQTESGWIGPGQPPPDEETKQDDWIGPGQPPEDGSTEAGWIGPGGPPA
jgi:hypothetical protein